MEPYPPPRVIPRSEHNLSRQLIDPDALKVLYRLHNHGFKAYLVGGCVRDLLLGKTPKDFDVATDAHPQQIRQLFRNSRLVGRRFRLAHVYFRGGKIIEVFTFRRHTELEREKRGAVAHDSFGTPAEDAYRRDITINGIFYNLANFSLEDYVGGLEDLQKGIIRCIGDPDEKFVNDPVRMIRVIRHAARTGFVIEARTFAGLIKHGEKINLCSPVRVRDEFMRELQEGMAQESMKLMIESGFLYALFPSLILPLSEDGHQDCFLRLLQILDKRLSGSQTLPAEFCLAFFLLPFLNYFCPPEQFPSGRAGQVLYQQKIKEWVGEILRPWEFPGRVKETVVRLLSYQRICRAFNRSGKIPLRLWRQPFFSQALKFFLISSSSFEQPPPKI